MTQPRILVQEERKGSPLEPSPSQAWLVLGTVGIAFALVAAVDLVLVWYPLGFGNREWEFGTVTAVFGGLPLLLTGAGLGIASGLQRGRGLLVRVMSGFLILLALLLVVMLVLYSRTLSAALGSSPDPLVVTGIRKAIAKTLLQGVMYTAASGVMGISGWRRISQGAAG
jgi:hypothetical protein